MAVLVALPCLVTANTACSALPASAPRALLRSHAVPSARRLHRLVTWRHLAPLRGGEDAQVADPSSITFKRKAKVGKGNALFVTGDCETLGFQDVAKAVPMKEGKDGVWEAAIKGIPYGANYQYLVAPAGGPTEATSKTTTSFKYHVWPPSMGGEDTKGGPLTLDDTVVRARFIVRKGASELKVVGSIPELGVWDAAKAPKLTKTEDNKWEGVVEIASERLEDFVYKLCADGKMESGLDRHSDLFYVEPQPDPNGQTANLECIYEGLLTRFIMFHPVGPTERMVITGKGPGLGDWQPADNPRRMGLGNYRTLLTNIKGRCWEATFPAAQEDIEKVSYRYIIVNDETRSTVWESEPNRFIECLPGAISTSSGKYRQREYTQFDGNFVAKELSFDDIDHNLFCGAYPQCLEDVLKMKEAGVTGILNLQTDEDIHKRQVNMDMMDKHYRDNGMELCRVPILDFHGDDMAARGKFGVKEVSRMLHNNGKGGKVYVHCTAGMGRAPAVLCLYLVHREGYKLEDAMSHIKHRRPSVGPNYEAMKQAIRNGLNC